LHEIGDDLFGFCGCFLAKSIVFKSNRACCKWN